MDLSDDLAHTEEFPPPDLIASCFSAGREYKGSLVNLEDAYEDKVRQSPVNEPAYVSAEDLSNRDSWVVVHDWFSLPKVREVENCLITLQCGKDVSIIISTLQCVEDFFPDEEKIGYLVERKAHTILLQAMGKFWPCPEIQIRGCSILIQLIATSEECKWEIQYSPCYSHLLHIMKNHPFNEELNFMTIQVLTLIAESDDVRRDLRRNDNDEGLNFIVNLIHSFSEHAELVLSACRLIGLFIFDDTVEHDLFLYENLCQNLILSLKRNLTHIGESRNIVNFLRLVVDEAAGLYVDGLRQCGLPLQCLTLLSCHLDVNTPCEVISRILELIHVLLESDLEARQCAITQGLGRSLITTMLRYENPETISEACKVTSQICDIYFSDTKLLGGIGLTWIEVLHKNLCLFREDACIQNHSCFILARLLDYHSDLALCLEERGIPLHSSCFGTLLIFGDKHNPDVFANACELIYWLACDNENMRWELISANVHEAIILGLKHYFLCSMACAKALKALRGLCIFSLENKTVVSKTGNLTLYIDVLKVHMDEMKASIETTALIASLCELDIVVNQFLIEYGDQLVLESMGLHHGSAKLIEVSIEALIALCSAEGAPEILIGHGALPAITRAMNSFIHLEMIQMKVLMLLQFLVNEIDYSCYSLIDEVVRGVVRAMGTHKTSYGVQSEGTVVFLAMVKRDPDICLKFIHLDFFGIVCDNADFFRKSNGFKLLTIHSVAALMPFKEAVLHYACANEYTVAAECMIQLGADVNIGKGLDSPICHACKYQNVHLVSLILQEHVHDLQFALKLALGLRSETVIGLLLYNIGYNRDEGAIAWDGLDLRQLPDSWVEPTFLGTAGCNTKFSAISQWYAKEVKLCNERDQRNYLSECLLESTEHHVHGSPRSPFRFSLTSPATHPSATPDHDGTYKASKNDGLSWLKEDYICWKKTTISGANFRFSPWDPRQTAIPKLTDTEIMVLKEYPWGRKREAGTAEKNGSTRLISSLKRCISEPQVNKVKKSSGSADFKLSNRWKSFEYGASMFGSHAGNLDHETKSDKNVASTDERKPPAHHLHSPNVPTASSGNLNSDDSVVSVAVSDIKPIISMDISSNGLRDLSSLGRADQKLLDRFQHITKFDASKNKLRNFPQGLLVSMKNIEALNLSCNELNEFPSIETCCKLKSLNLSNNKLCQITLDSEAKLECLEELDLERNGIEYFPTFNASAIPNIVCLNISRNALSDLQEESLYFPRLQNLNLAFNNLRSLPDKCLTCCPQLKSMDVRGNLLEKLPSENIAAQLNSLLTLDVSHNSLGTGADCKEPFHIPKFILALPSLKYINLSHNRLDTLPTPNYWNSTNLRGIDASHNSMKVFNIGQHGRLWAALDKLNLSHNKLRQLPREIGQLTSLSSLNISHNPGITTLPDEIGKLSRLWEFGLEGLNLDLDSSILRGRTRDLIGYLHEKLKKSIEFNHMRLMLVGYGGRGKSTLLRALMKQRQAEKSTATVGVVVRNWRYAVWKRTGFVTNTLNCWDFAGQEDFYSKHEYFLSDRAVYLVVYDLSKGLSELRAIKPWLVNIYASAPHSPVIMVGTHRDLVPIERRAEAIREMRTNIRELTDRPGYPEIKGMIELCCTRENPLLEKLRIIVKQIVDGFHVKGQAVMGQKIPASYITLQEILQEELKSLTSELPIINHAQLWQLIREKRLDLDEEELKQAVRFLHDVGILMHYEDSSMQLSQLYFLDPEWLCRMMAQIVTVHEINPFINRNGIMKKRDLKLLFTGKKLGEINRSFVFPPSFIPYYMKLLERFQIAMPLNDDELLIPSKLSDTAPAFSLPIKGIGGHQGACLIRRQYLMQYIPFGFGTRLLIRLLLFVRDPIVKEEYGAKSNHEIVYWRRGLYVCFEEHAFFQVICDTRGDIHVLELMVPPTRHGARLLGQVVDHIDAMIEEWYPGLLEMTPLGLKPMEKLAPCIQCRPPQIHVFDLDALIKQAEQEDTVHCPNHSETVPLTLLAPEVVLGDFEQHYQISHENLALVQSPKYLIGDGSFGRVYKAKYHHRDVAVKVYLHGDMPLHTLLRQEATILQKLNHPSLLSLVGVAVRPWVLVVELAVLGDLCNILKRDLPMSRALQHRIALQVADGLQFLHKHKIVYRDMKPDNILVFSLSTTAEVNVKISDYGISRFTAPYGILGAEGTPGYRAPEVLSGQPYRFEADIYSYGVTIYKVMTRGKHPYKNAEHTNELDELAMRGAPLQPLGDHDIEPWPDMEDIISQCLLKNPASRPSSEKLTERLSRPDLLSLQYTLPVSRGLAVDCMATTPHDNGVCEIWLACADALWSQISWMKISRKISEPTGTLFADSRILCMEPIEQDYLVVGTQSGRVWVFDVTSHKRIHALNPLSDAVVSLLHFKRDKTADFIIAGTADGTIAVYNSAEILSGDIPLPECISIAGPGDPVMVMCTTPSLKARGRVYVNAGNCIVSVRVGEKVEQDVTASWKTCQFGGTRGVICGMAIHKKSICVIKRGSAVVEQWNITSKKLIKYFRVDEYLIRRGEKLINHFEARLLTMKHIKGSGLWIGTASGHIVLMDFDKLSPLVTVRRHAGLIRTMLWMPMSGIHGNHSTSSVVVSGMGYISDGTTHNPDDGYLTFWDADLYHTSLCINEHIHKRHVSQLME